MRPLFNHDVFVGHIFPFVDLIMWDGSRMPAFHLPVIGLNQGCPHKPRKHADHAIEQHRFDAAFCLSMLDGGHVSSPRTSVFRSSWR